MELIDLAGFSKPITKLLDVFQAGCKFIFKPSYIRRIEMAKLDAEKMKDEYQMHKRIKDSIVDKIIDGIANESLSIREQRQLKNIADVYAYAENELRMLDSVSPEPVDEDWASRFFDYAKDVSDDEIKIIWGKILAGEIKSPRSFFKRTLTVLRDIETFEAKWFHEACKFVISDSLPAFVLNEDFYPYNQFQTLVDCGLVNSESCEINIDNKIGHIKFQNYNLNIVSYKSTHTMFEGYTLTDAGRQLFSLVQIDSTTEYIARLKQFLENGNFGLQLELR